MAAPVIVRYVKVSNLQEGNQYLVEWMLNSETDVDHYNIYRSEANYTGFVKVGEVCSTINQYIDRVPKNWGVTWFYKVTAVNSDPTPLESDLENSFPASVISVDGFPYETFLDQLTTGDLVKNDTVVGTQNGTNVDFQTHDVYIPDSLEVIYERQVLVRGIDYTEESNNDFKFIIGGTSVLSSAPGASDYIRVNYIKA